MFKVANVLNLLRLQPASAGFRAGEDAQAASRDPAEAPLMAAPSFATGDWLSPAPVQVERPPDDGILSLNFTCTIQRST